jgi:hypothetical protein
MTPSHPACPPNGCLSRVVTQYALLKIPDNT